MSSALLLLRGGQAVGKSSVAERLARDHDFVVLTKDDLYLPAMAETGDHHRASHIAYEGMKHIITTNRDSGRDFAIDAPLRRSEEVLAWREHAHQLGYVCSTVLLYCGDRDMWNERLSQRAGEGTANHLITSLEELEATGAHEVEPCAEEFSINTCSPLSLNEIALYCATYARS